MAGRVNVSNLNIFLEWNPFAQIIENHKDFVGDDNCSSIQHILLDQGKKLECNSLCRFILVIHEKNRSYHLYQKYITSEKFPQEPLMTCDEGLIGCVQERNTLNLQCNTVQYSAILCNTVHPRTLKLGNPLQQRNTKRKKTLLQDRTQQFSLQPCSR